MSKKLWGELKRLTPISLGLNLFVLLSTFVSWRLNEMEVTQKIFFPFGVMALFAISLFSQPKRKLVNWPIGLFVLWSLINVFIHAEIWNESSTWRYFNFWLMSEGFIHVFCAAILYKLIYENVDRLPALWIPIGYYLYRAVAIRSLTPIFAVIICLLIYCIAKKRFILTSLITIGTTWFIHGNWQYIVTKAQSRVFAWPYTIKEILKHPFGCGFDKNLMCNLILGPNGWCLRQNDYLNIGRDLGTIALIIIAYFLFRFFRRFDFRFLSMACLCSLIICFFQTTMYRPKLAIIVISLFALKAVCDGKRCNWGLRQVSQS